MEGILTRQLVAKAFALVQPLIQITLSSGATRGKNLVIVVDAVEEINPRKTHMMFETECFLVEVFGDPKEFGADYRKIALSKAELSVRTGLPNSKIMPQYLLKGDTVYTGSVIIDGIVVAASGDDGHFDEMFSGWLALTIQALCKARFKQLKADDSIHFVS